MTRRVLVTCGVPIDPLDLGEAAARIIRAASQREALAVHLVNAYTLSLAVRDHRFRDTVGRGHLNLPDGMPLVWLARRHGLHLDDRVYGPDLTLAVCDLGRRPGLRHYLYGGTPEVVEGFAASLRQRFNGIEIVGAESPPFRDLTADEETAVVDRIAASGADIVWVGLGTPKQDLFVDHFASRIARPLVAVGAAFDFIAGTKPMAPAWMQRRGLEWLYRLGSEPRRLWRRYLVGNLVFLYGATRDTRVETISVA
jgi:N-acetylglucosaminyldiphosphoundecaprenol N-acetyl-beta-D-mannosaminyltransferase